MSKRGKLQEFAAHTQGVNCLHIGRKSGQVMVTGGDDRKVNMWAVGKPNAIMSFAGHASPVECVTFDTQEEVVVAGSSSGTLKLWDLQQAKVVRTLNGHRANAISVDFHPYGEFFASGSRDTNLKVWDIRRKGCIQTYRGHEAGVNVIRFSPDGRWVVSGDEKGAVKLWDLTAGKMLTEFKSHRSKVSDIAFHPNEFLLATASEDRSLKFWDLETFDLVSNLHDSTRTRHMAFANEGACLVSASDQFLKVVGWEPPQCYDALDVGWDKIADLHIVNDQLVACGIDQTFVSVWAVNLTQCKPWATGSSTSRSGAGSSSARGGSRSTSSGAGDASSGSHPKSSAPATGSHAASKLPWNQDSDAAAPKKISSRDDARRPSEPDLSATGRHQSVGVGGDSLIKTDYHSTPPRTKKWSKEKDNEFTPAVQKVDPAARALHRERDPVAPAGGPRDIIPSSRHAPVGLDVEAFLPQASGKASASGPQGDDEILRSVSKQHSTLATVLQTRLTNVRAIRTFWQSGDVKGAFEHMIELNDPAISVDVLNVISQKSSVFTLDLAVIILPILLDLLRSQYEEYVKLSLSVLNMLCKSFGSLIEQTRNAPRPAGHANLVYEERVRKCESCYQSFATARKDAQALVTTKALGPAARLFITTADSYLSGIS